MKTSTKLSLCGASVLMVGFLWFLYKKRKFTFTKKVYGAYDDDNDISSISALRLSDDDQEEETVSIVSLGDHPNANEITDEKDKNNTEDVNHSATKSADVISISGNDDVIQEFADIEVLSSSSESIEWSDMASSESSINSDKNTQTLTSVYTFDIDRVQSSLHEQISSPVVQTHDVNRHTEKMAEKQRATDDFPFLMGGSTVCEYIDREYREVVTGKNAINETLNANRVL